MKNNKKNDDCYDSGLTWIISWKLIFFCFLNFMLSLKEEMPLSLNQLSNLKVFS